MTNSDPSALWPDREQLLGMSGLAFMQALLDGTLSAPPMATTMNFQLVSVDDGHVRFRGTPLASHTNPMGTVHGGWYGTILDSAMGCAVMTKVPKGRFYTTLEYKVNITRPIALGAEVEATAEVSHAGRTTSTVQGSITGVDDGRLYATGSSTCLIMTP